MPSFDIVSVTDLQEVDNAMNSLKREIENRYDFKDSKCSIERKDKEITILADDDYKLKTMQELLKVHMTRRKVDPRALDFKKAEAAAGSSQRQVVVVKQGIDQETAKEIVKALKDQKFKAQGSIRGEELRVTGPKKDTLQEVITFVKNMKLELPVQFVNFRD